MLVNVHSAFIIYAFLLQSFFPLGRDNHSVVPLDRNFFRVESYLTNSGRGFEDILEGQIFTPAKPIDRYQLSLIFCGFIIFLDGYKVAWSMKPLLLSDIRPQLVF